jgi:hypothetical protein
MTNNLNTLLRGRLESAGCIGGHLKAEFTSTFLITLSATKEKDGKPMLIWDIGYPLQKAVRDYMESAAPDMAILNIEIDLLSDTFNYLHTSTAQRAAAQQQQQMQNEQDEKQRQLDFRNRLAADTTPFGYELAENVAQGLVLGNLGNSHRDYCGMGLEIKNGNYLYGELYDGYMMSPTHSFPDRQSFVHWLAQQSNASLSRIEVKDPWVWGNQVITRQRLIEFTHNLSR